MMQTASIPQNEAEADALLPDVDEWVKTGYIYDVTMPYGQLLAETTESATTSYVYGLERVSALSGTLKTQYVYDGRGVLRRRLIPWQRLTRLL